MSAPAPITKNLTVDAISVRTHSISDCERVLVAFIKQIFQTAYMLDNPAVNELQATRVDPRIYPPVTPSVPFDPTQRAQTLEGKVPPQVVRGRVPRTVTGEVDATALPNVPAILVEAVASRVEILETLVTVRILASAYDENPESQGYADVQNMLEAISIGFSTFGQLGIDESYVIVMPFNWKMEERNTFPHFFGEMETQWEFPTAGPYPNLLTTPWYHEDKAAGIP